MIEELEELGENSNSTESTSSYDIVVSSLQMESPAAAVVAAALDVQQPCTTLPSTHTGKGLN